MSDGNLRLEAIAAVLAVAAANIGLNFFVRRAAAGTRTYSEALFSGRFATALCIGSASILLLLLVYRFDVNLAQGILLMGAASIVGGSLISVWLFGNKLRSEEWVLLLAIGALFAFRWVQASVR
ncbi:MAG TPA: hypothetical protein VGJ81_05485 [Thermoanaerobaculia bacterium]|jgi:hypothetical protein